MSPLKWAAQPLYSGQVPICKTVCLQFLTYSLYGLSKFLREPGHGLVLPVEPKENFLAIFDYLHYFSHCIYY